MPLPMEKRYTLADALIWDEQERIAVADHSVFADAAFLAGFQEHAVEEGHPNRPIWTDVVDRHCIWCKHRNDLTQNRLCRAGTAERNLTAASFFFLSR